MDDSPHWLAEMPASTASYANGQEGLQAVERSREGERDETFNLPCREYGARGGAFLAGLEPASPQGSSPIPGVRGAGSLGTL
jgi:hypothetical protein